MRLFEINIQNRDFPATVVVDDLLISGRSNNGIWALRLTVAQIYL